MPVGTVQINYCKSIQQNGMQILKKNKEALYAMKLENLLFMLYEKVQHIENTPCHVNIYVLDKKSRGTYL